MVVSVRLIIKAIRTVLGNLERVQLLEDVEVRSMLLLQVLRIQWINRRTPEPVVGKATKVHLWRQIVEELGWVISSHRKVALR